MSKKNQPSKWEAQNVAEAPDNLNEWENVNFLPLPKELRGKLDKIWILSDTHFFHDNIIKYQNRPETHHSLMINNWNNTVAFNQVILHLGDVVHGVSLTDLDYRFPKLMGKIYLVPGNHDIRKRCLIFQEKGWKIIRPFTLQYRGYDIKFTHKPIETENLMPHEINVHGHTHSHPPQSKQHINVSVEHLNYTPTLLQPLLDKQIDELNLNPVKAKNKESLGIRL